MPAESQVAPGCSATRSWRTPASRANAVAGSSSSGATAISPRSVSIPASSPRRRGQPGRAGSAPERPVAPGGSRLDLEQHVERRSDARAPRGQRPHELAPVDRLDDVGVGRDRGGLVALQAADEVPAQPEVGALGRLGLGLLVAVLPTSVTPRSASSRTSLAGKNLVTTASSTSPGARPASAQAAAIRAAHVLEVGARAPRPGRGLAPPDDAGEPPGGGPVAAVGVEAGSSRVQPPTGDADAAASSWARNARGEVEGRRAPGRGRPGRGPDAAISARISSGTS